MPDEDREDSEYQPRWNELITLQEAAKLSGLSSSHLRLLASNEDIWSKKLGATWYTTEQAVSDYLARDHRPGPKSKQQN